MMREGNHVRDSNIKEQQKMQERKCC